MISDDIPIMEITKRSDWLDVRDMGAKGDGKTDDTVAIQAAFDMLKSNSKLSGVYFPEGTFLVSKTLTVGGDLFGKTIAGHGRNTILKWSGTTNDPMLHSMGMSYSIYNGLTWDGNNVASIGVWHHSTTVYESMMVHKNEAFKNFTQAGIESYGGDQSTNLATAEVYVHNCLFDNTHYGLNIGTTQWNDYDWVIDQSEIKNNVIGIRAVKGQVFIYNTHFSKNSDTDILAQNSAFIRRVTSEGSYMFFRDDTFSSSGQKATFENINVDGWTNPNGIAVSYGYRGAMMLIDSSFTSSPKPTVLPVYVPGRAYEWTQHVTTSNNYFDGGPDVLDRTKDAIFIDIPVGVRAKSNLSASTTFLDSTTVTEGPLIEVVDNKVATLQSAVDKAAAANNGTIVYIPLTGSNFVFDRTINVHGKNYTIEGSGLRSYYYFSNGDSSSVFFHMNGANNVQIKKMTFSLTNGETGIVQDTDGNNIYDYLQTKDEWTNQDKSLFKFTDLSANSQVLLRYNKGKIEVTNSEEALIFSKMHLSRVLVNGISGDGFIGFRWLNSQNITVKDSASLTIGDFYSEQVERIFDFCGNKSDPAGRITIGGMQKVHSYSNLEPETMLIENYHGDINFMQGNFAKYAKGTATGKILFKQAPTPSNKAKVTMLGIGFTNWTDISPYDIEMPETNTSIVQSTVVEDYNGNKYDIPNTPLDNTLENDIGNAFDDLRELGQYDLTFE